MLRMRFQLGERVPLSVRTVNNNGTASEPAAAPLAMVYSDTAFVTSVRVPICDRYGITGAFEYEMLLDGKFATGRYTVIYHYTISSTPYAAQQEFEVVAGGNVDGAGLALFHYARPGTSYLLSAHDSGRLIRKRNPRV